MANLRLVEIKAINSTTIKARFTESLDTAINTSNVSITSNLESVPNPEVLKVTVSGKVMKIITRPMTPYAAYFVEFKSSDITDFKSLNGTSFLLEDGNTNVPLILGPEDPSNPIRDTLIDFLKDTPYNLQSKTLVRDIVNHQADYLAKALYDIRQLKNDNYLSFTVVDEQKTRGAGSFDRLNEEGAYKVLRVGKRKTGANLEGSISFASFPSGPITVQRVQISGEKLVAGTTIGTFNGLTLNAKNRFVTKLTKVRIVYAVGGSAEYSISNFGYQIINSKYDQDHASTYLGLEDNQFKLNENSLDSGFVSPAPGDIIYIDYEYQHKGRHVDESTLQVTQVLNATREATPPIVTEFSLLHAPIVTSSDSLATSGGVEFLDPEANPPFSDTHPAFTREIPFRYDGLPASPGEYSIDYSTGRVFVYGSDSKDGTGNFPPAATYKYRKVFGPRLDYTYDPDTLEVVANPERDLSGQKAKITFSYEDNLVPDVDFVAQVHNEVLDERINNKIKSTVSISTQKSPITNVFRVFNETSGEVYKVQRWNNDTIYFTSNVPPRILDAVRERVSFTDVFNETLLVNNEFVNSIGTRVFKILLGNNRIIAGSQDTIGSKFNSSIGFSRSDIFDTELYYDGQVLSAASNYNKLKAGQYQVDYDNGIIYLGVNSSQEYNLGTINYKKSTIAPINTHLVSVSEIYHSVDALSGISKRIPYLSFNEGEITPSSFDRSDERFLNGDSTLPYTVDSGTITVSDDIKEIRGIYDHYDLVNNVEPLNFADGASFSSNVITLDSTGVEKSEVLTIGSGSVLTVTYLSPSIEISSVVRIVRLSDNLELSASSFSDYTINLSSTNSPAEGDEVLVIYKLSLNSSATPIVDYNRGGYYVDYSYLADEILVSYEYGDNVLDFRESGALDEGNTYFVTYKVGALRDSLLKNFGTLVDIPILNTFDTTLPRESYRDALMAALQSFTKGPTVPSMKKLVSTITHIEPDLTESAFEGWSLGLSHLYPEAIKTTGDLQLSPAKFDNGVLVKNSDETIRFPISSNLRLEEGTLETWIIPEWNGLDNDASLTFEVTRNGEVLDSSKIFIGADSHHPSYDLNNKFTINRMDSESPVGLPSAVYSQTGMFIYYDNDSSRWKVLVKDAIEGNGHVYSGTVTSSGEVYDVKFIPGLGEVNDLIRSSLNKIEFEFNIDGYDALSPDGYQDGYSVVDGYYPGDGYVAGYSYDGIHFMADDEHYIFDFGKTEHRNRFSLYKDGRGYLNFRIFDKGERAVNKYQVSADISDWQAGESHHVAISWKINSSDHRDEMHLFIDGFEVPNIIRYGGRPVASSSDRFRTVKPEIVVGSLSKNAIVGNDLITLAGSNTVTSDSMNFTSLVNVGDTIHIKETGFSSYTILAIDSSSLTLDSTMPYSLNDARFSINEYSTTVSSELDLFNNIIVSKLSGGEETELPGLRADLPAYEISKNALNQNVLTILGEANAGDQILVRTLGLNHRRCRDRVFIWGNTNSVLKTQLPSPINLDEVKIIPVLLTLTSIGPDNSTLSAGAFTSSALTTSQPSNDTEGRTLSIRMTGSNVDFTTPATVTITGSSSSGATSETLSFTSAGTKNSSNKFTEITSVVVEVTPIDESKNSVAIEIKEAYEITYSEGNDIYPVIRYSYKVQTGSTLEGDGSATIVDSEGYFTESMVGNSLVIKAPLSVAGTYTITSRVSDTSVTVSPTPNASFSGGTYDIYNVSIGRSGFQNGFFTLEQAGATNTPFYLKEGFFEFDYSSYLEIPFSPVSGLDGYVGSDLNGSKQAKAIIDEFRILSKQLSDVRVGESIADNEDSITTDYTAIRPFKANSDTLMLLHFNSLPFKNESDYWITSTKEYLQSGSSVNENFSKSIVFNRRPLIVENKGYLTTSSEGTIEFWVSPRYDTYNDPNYRFYFDASGSLIEETVSTTDGIVKVDGKISQILSVRLQTDTENTGVDYFAGGSVQSDFQTIKLGKKLPYQKTPVKINYIQSGLVGDRISIYKDKEGYITLNVRAKGIDYQVRQPVFWERDSWHRVRATYKFNRADNQDEIRLFVDGEEKGIVLFGSGIFFGSSIIMGQGFAGVDNSRLTADINFKDPLNQFYIGSDYFGTSLAQARIDNLRLSNIARVPLSVAGQDRDVNYSSNLDIVLPVIEDAFTTYLLNFDTIAIKNEDFALIKDEKFGIFNFTLDIIDSFDIVLSNSKIKQVLELLISALKPAQSKVTINYKQ